MTPASPHSAPPASPGTPIRDLFSIPVNAMRMEEVLDRVDDTIARRGGLQIGVVNAAKIVNMRRNDLLRRSVLSSDLILADGISVVWASRLLGRPLPERVAGIDLMMGMFRRGNERGYKIFCLGATDEVLDKVAERITSEFPNIRQVGRQNGYFPEEEEEAIAGNIAAANPDILLVAMTSPKKEKFLARWSDRLGTPVCHGVGGSFDVFAGKVLRAPERWQRLGLEWLYRLKQEPRRLWRRYLTTNTLFCAMVLSELLKRRPRPSAR